RRVMEVGKATKRCLGGETPLATAAKSPVLACSFEFSNPLPQVNRSAQIRKGFANHLNHNAPSSRFYALAARINARFHANHLPASWLSLPRICRVISDLPHTSATDPV